MNPQISTWTVIYSMSMYMHTVHLFPSYTNIHDSSKKARHSIILAPHKKENLPLVQVKTTTSDNHVRASHQVSSTARRLHRIGPQTNRLPDNTKQNSTSFRQRWRRRLDFCVLATYLCCCCYGIGLDGMGWRLLVSCTRWQRHIRNAHDAAVQEY